MVSLASPLWESNPRHQPYHGCALPTELRGPVADRRPGVIAADDDSQPAMEVRLAIAERRRGHPGDLQPRGHRVDRHLRPGPPHPRAAAAWLADHAAPTRPSWPSRTGEVVGFGSLSPYKERPAYATTVENSVFVHRDHRVRAWAGAARGAGAAGRRPRLPRRDRPHRRAATRRRSGSTGLRLRRWWASRARSAASSAAGSTSSSCSDCCSSTTNHIRSLASSLADVRRGPEPRRRPRASCAQLSAAGC